MRGPWKQGLRKGGLQGARERGEGAGRSQGGVTNLLRHTHYIQALLLMVSGYSLLHCVLLFFKYSGTFAGSNC